MDKNEQYAHTRQRILHGCRLVLSAGFVFIAIGINPLFGQNEFANWVWRDSNFVSWNSGAPVLQTGFDLETSRPGQACISDRNGNLLLVADGDHFYNGSGQLMINGAPAISSRSEQTFVVPYPCNDSLYYVFWTSSLSVVIPGVHYSLVNVYSNGGQGEVIQHDILLDSTMALALDITRHENNRDYWLVSRKRAAPVFYAWQITDTGIISQPVISLTDSVLNYANFHGDHTNEMKFSPNGEWLAYTDRHVGAYVGPNHITSLFSFDQQTGIVQREVQLNTSSLPYNTRQKFHCFSPDNSKLYIVAQERALYQFDLLSNDSSTIANSGTTIASYAQYSGLTDIQIANDNKLYIARSHGSNAPTYLSVIHSPNSPGMLCNFSLNGFQCNQWTYWRLPNRLHNLYISREITHANIKCTIDTTVLELTDYRHLDSTVWYIDTGTAMVSFVSDSAGAFVFDSSGFYPVMAVCHSGCRMDTLYDTLNIRPTPLPDIGSDTVLCEGDSINFFTSGQFNYLWSTGDTTEGVQILQPDTYWLELSNVCGLARDTVIVDSIIKAIVDFGLDDTLLCEGESLLIDATVEQGTYLWHDGSTDSVFYASQADTIWVEALNVCNITPATDTMIVRFTDIPVIPELDSVLCSGQNYFIDLTTDSVSQFVWYDGHTGAFDTITLQNTYWVKEWNVCGQDSTDFLVAFVNDPQTLLGDDTVLCISDSMVLDASTPFGTYVWNTGDTSGAITIDESYLSGDSNYYIVTVYNACKSDTDDIIIAADFYLDVDLGDDLVMCKGDSVWLEAATYPRTDYEWHPNGETTREIGFIAEENAEYAVMATNTCGTFSDTLKLVVDQALTPDLGSDQVVCMGDTLLLHAGDFERTSYRWMSRDEDLDEFENERKIQLIAGNTLLPNDTASMFQLLLENECGVFSDSVFIEVDSLPEHYAMDSVFFCEDSFAMVSIQKSDIDFLEWQDGSRESTRKIDQETSWNITFVNHCGSTTQMLPSVRKYRPEIKLESPQKICEYELVLQPEITNRPQNQWSPTRYHDFLWSDGTTLDEMAVTRTGSYAVTVTNVFGCYDSARVQVKTCGADWYIPNAFTPGSDGRNDYWKPEGEGIYSYEIKVFDRWGHAVFSFTESDPGWDGSIKNQPAQSGIYTYQMTIFSEDFRKGRVVTGVVAVVR